MPELLCELRAFESMDYVSRYQRIKKSPRCETRTLQKSITLSFLQNIKAVIRSSDQIKTFARCEMIIEPLCKG